MQHAKYQITDTQPFNSGPSSTPTIPGCNMGFSNKIQSREDVDKSDNFEVLARIKRGSSWCIYEYDFIKQT